jgi:hypothetical protein
MNKLKDVRSVSNTPKVAYSNFPEKKTPSIQPEIGMCRG